MIKQNSGEPNVLPYKKAASTVFAFNDVVTRNATGYLVRATSATPRSRLLGLIQRDVLTTDVDYASAIEVPVLLFDEECEFLADVSTGSAIQAMVGKRFDLDDENSINVNVSNNKHVEITRILSTTQVKVKVITTGAPDSARLVTFSQSFTVAEFTDGGSTTGTLALKCVIPAGAVFVQTILTELTGFAGDTSATVQVGDGSDVDRYSTGTPDVFSTLAAGIDMGVPSGTKFHSALKTVTVTVTTNADFTTCKSNGAGAATIGLFWYEVAS